ncbi:MAG: chloride channel protein [Clostridia bacterium]|nr:chloride channel protein [Clostridia bacterium]
MLKKNLKIAFYYIRSFVGWVLTSAVVGMICGLVGALFAYAVEWATHARETYAFLPWLMPVAGLAIAGLYRLLKLPLSIGTDEIITTVRTQDRVPLAMAPAIFLATVLTHLTGGSAGREGAALQLGGSIGVALSAKVAPMTDNRRIFQLCGMAALFSALFGTPIAATIFVVEIIEVGRINERALLPCMVSALTAKFAAMAVGAPVEAFPLGAGLAAATSGSVAQAAGLGIACAVVALVFCHVMHGASKLFKRAIPNDFLRIAAGAAAVLLLSLLLGTNDYRGSGMHVILKALEGEAVPAAFLLKIVFTALSLGVGFKGGEIVPSFFIGATMGCTAAGLLGLAPGLGAALGIIGVFCGVTNAPLASMMLAVELFGAEYLLLFGVTVGVSYALSGHVSLYHTQTFAEPKMGHRD